jgi:RND family efflux transporter MFP subunit
MKTRLDAVARPSAALGLALFLCLPGLLCGCSNGRAGGGRNGAAPAATGTPSDSARSLAVLVVGPGLDPSGAFTTFLEPVVDAPAIARHRGIVRSVAVVEGQRVGSHQILAQLEDEEQRLDYDRAEAVAAQAKAERDRAEKAIVQNLIAQYELEVARAKDEAARADAALAKLAYDRCTVRAPIAGVVRLVRVEPHALVEEDEILFRVAVADRLKASLYLPAALGRHFSVGDAVGVVSASDPSSPPGTGRVHLVNPVGDPVTGLVHVQIELAAGPGLTPGADVRVVPAGAPDAAPTSPLGGAILPRGSYLEREGGRLFVYKVVGGMARKTAVDLGASSADGFAVLSGLQPGDLVMAAGQVPPRDGMPVAARLGSGR